MRPSWPGDYLCAEDGEGKERERERERENQRSHLTSPDEAFSPPLSFSLGLQEYWEEGKIRGREAQG